MVFFHRSSFVFVVASVDKAIAICEVYVYKLNKKLFDFFEKRLDKLPAIVYNRYCCEGQRKNENLTKFCKTGV